MPKCDTGACVKAVPQPDGTVHVYSTLNPDVVTPFTAKEWEVFVADLREQGRAERDGELTFRAVSEINRVRCERWHPGFPADGWTGSDWSNAMAGEAGETCNVVKKLRRDDFGKVQAAADSRADLVAKLATEIGDTFLYLDLLAQFYGLDIARCVVDTFNRVSNREGFPDYLEAQTAEVRDRG